MFFALSGLDLLCALQEVESMRANIVEWIYAQQVLPDETNPGVLAWGGTWCSIYRQYEVCVCVCVRACVSVYVCSSAWCVCMRVCVSVCTESNMHKCGFRGGGFGGVPFNNEQVSHLFFPWCEQSSTVPPPLPLLSSAPLPSPPLPSPPN